MKNVLLMAVDLGTSFIKAAAYTPDGACLAQAMEPVKDYRPQPGVFIQKGEELFDSVVACMREVTARLGDGARRVSAIVFSGQMSGFMGVSRDWEDVTTWSCSLDQRYMPYARRQMDELRDTFLTVAGTNFPQMAPKYAWYKAEFPTESARIAKYLMISGYVIGRLGRVPIEDAVIDRSYISWTGLADVGRDAWSDTICDAIGLDKSTLPRIVDCNTVCGHLCREMAGVIGLPEGVPLVAGAGDKVAGCLGAGNVQPGRLVFEASSYGEVSGCVAEYRPDLQQRRLDVLCSAIPGEYYVTHFAAGSGITLDWFIDGFYRHPGESKAEAFARMEDEVAQIPIGSNGVMAIGLLGGSSMPLDGAVRGLWMGQDWSHGPAHLYRALLESFAYDFTLAMQSMNRLYPEHPFDEVRVIGGGAKSPAWIQMNADVSGKGYVGLAMKDVSMWGSVLLAGNAIGLWPNLREAAEAGVKRAQAYAPNPAATAAYAPYLQRYGEYLVSLRGHFEQLQQL